MQDSAINLLRGLVERYSPSGKEDEVGYFLSSRMEELGFLVKRDIVGNVIGEHGDGSPRVLLCGHMDTVPPELPVRLEDGILYGRGTVDAKGPLAALVMAASGLVDDGHSGTLIVVGAVDEEGMSTGVKNLVNDGLEADYAIFGEPTNVETITVGYKGGLVLKIDCETETGHSSAPWLFKNAIEKAMGIWHQVKSLQLPEEDSESRFHSVSYCLRRIKGGGIGSVVPSSCQILVEARIPPAVSVDRLSAELLALINAYRVDNPDVNVYVEILGHTEPYLSDKRSPLVRAVSRSIWRNRKAKVGLINKTGTGDMNIYGRATGTPTITYGPGDPHLDHTSYERIGVQDYLDSIMVLKGALTDLLLLTGQN
ncbi:MAG: M20/M25/M40 family metallo-hydrolase [Candidatus Bathyarchaeota archaeon]|jgi:LysW-gamma-L-lysine carboxypeptidase|nr:M20/M25/M40 family metallo-hydrolase [Candidatus Bathyarchaeota archaeon]